MKNARLYTNENFRQPLVRELRRLGYDVLTSREANQDNQGITDSEVLRFAISMKEATKYDLYYKEKRGKIMKLAIDFGTCYSSAAFNAQPYGEWVILPDIKINASF